MTGGPTDDAGVPTALNRLDAAEPLRTPRLALLPLGVEHAGEMARVLADPALHTFIGGAPATADTLRTRYARLAAGSPDPAVRWLNWVIALSEEECLTGTVQATVTAGGGAGAGAGAGGGPVAEIAWVVGVPWQGRGIASEAAGALVAWLRARGVRTVIAHVHPDHGASAAVAASAGLAPTADLHDGEVRWRLDPTPGAGSDVTRGAPGAGSDVTRGATPGAAPQADPPQS